MTHAIRLTRRRLLLAAALAALPLRPHAQKPDALRIVCGYPPGGSVDIVARKLAEKLTGRVAHQVVVDNKPGAAGRLAVDDLKKAAPGSALLVTPASTVTMYPHVYRQLSYDPFTDLVPVSAVATSGFVLAIGPKVPAAVLTLRELTRWCRTQAEPATCGHAGNGSMRHFMLLLAAREMGIELAPIPYRGGSAAMQGAAAGEVVMAFSTESSARALHQAGKLRALATTWDWRSPFFAEVPTFLESGVALTQREWFGTFMPARTAESQVRSVADAIRAIVSEVDVRETWERTSLVVEANGPTALSAAMRAEHDFWGPLVRASGFTPES
jgi:tripartite-type tricarboxylate transporter receptor subunit TctC